MKHKQEKAPDTLSIIQRLLQKKMTFPSWSEQEKLKTAEGRRQQGFGKEEKKEK